MPNSPQEDSLKNSATPMQATATKATREAKPRYQSSSFYSVQNLGLEHLSSRRIKLPAPDGVGDEYHAVVTYELLPDASRGKGKYLKLNHRTVGYICGGKAYGEVCFTDKEFVHEYHLEGLKVFRREGPGPYKGKGNRQGHFVYTKDEGNNSSSPWSHLLPTGSSLQAGAVCLINCVAQQLGITPLLQELWPQEHLKILSIIYFLCSHPSQNIYNLEAAAYGAGFPNMQGLQTANIKEVFNVITDDKIAAYQTKFLELTSDPMSKNKDHLIFDTLRSAPLGLVQQIESAPQSHLLLVISRTLQIPLYTQLPKTPKSEHTVLSQEMANGCGSVEISAKKFVFPNCLFVLGQESESLSTLRTLVQAGMHFVQNIPVNSTLAATAIAEVLEHAGTTSGTSDINALQQPENLLPELGCYHARSQQDYKIKLSFSSQAEVQYRIHVFYDPRNRADLWRSYFSNATLVANRLNHTPPQQRKLALQDLSKHEQQVLEYGFICKTQKDHWSVDSHKIDDFCLNHSFKVIACSNLDLEPVQIYEAYELKRLSSLYFERFYEDLGLNNAPTIPDSTTAGKLFVASLALTVLLEIRKRAYNLISAGHVSDNLAGYLSSPDVLLNKLNELKLTTQGIDLKIAEHDADIDKLFELMQAPEAWKHAQSIVAAIASTTLHHAKRRGPKPKNRITVASIAPTEEKSQASAPIVSSNEATQGATKRRGRKPKQNTAAAVIAPVLENGKESATDA